MVAETKKPVGEDQGRETPYIVSRTFAALRPGEFSWELLVPGKAFIPHRGIWGRFSRIT